MGSEANKDVVRCFFRALSEGRLDEADKLVAADAHWWTMGVGDMDLRKIKGVWAQFFNTPHGADTMKVISLTSEDDRVAAEVASDIPLPDGRPYRNTFFFLFGVRDGQIARVREYMNSAYVQEMFGAQAH
jgi:ketosteroid isomerase-like protein